MLVSFYFDCPIHGRFVEYLDTRDYPARNWPRYILCPKTTQDELAERQSLTDNFSPDSFWSGKKIVAMDQEYTSRDYFKRDLKTKGLSEITPEEYNSQVRKSMTERQIEHFHRPDVVRERFQNLSETLDGFGVIDGLTEN